MEQPFERAMLALRGFLPGISCPLRDASWLCSWLGGLPCPPCVAVEGPSRSGTEQNPALMLAVCLDRE